MSEVFDIGHESDLSEYTSTVTDGGDLSQGSPGLASTSGRMEALIDDTTAIYGQKDYTQLTSDDYRLRFYIHTNSLTMAGGDEFSCCGILQATAWRAVVRLQYDGSNYRIRAGLRDDGDSAQYTGYYTITDAEHYIEVLVERASSDVASDAEITLWIDGTEKENKTGIDWYDLSKPDSARLGPYSSLDSGTSGTLYLDEFVLRDDDTQIGPVGAAAGLPVISGEGLHSLVFGGVTVR